MTPMTDAATAAFPTLDPRKFRDADVTADGEPRARVAFAALETLWFNTGTLCNLTCRNCYIESSPHNDSLVYLTATEVAAYLDEIEAGNLGTGEIGFTGGEPFMNPDIIAMMADCLGRGFRTLVLTNAMRPMLKLEAPLLDLTDRHGDRLAIRVSVDHYSQALHEIERGPRSWQVTIEGVEWLAGNGFNVNVAGRTCWTEPEAALRKGYARLFADRDIPIDSDDPHELVLFPEMDARADVPEITENCWGILGIEPQAIMCATSRMVIKHKGAERPAVVSCTLLPYDPQYELGHTLAEASKTVKLNHPHCASFCVLGGGSCSSG